MSIFSRFISGSNLILHKGDNLRIFTTLTWNKVLSLKLKLYKALHGIHYPIVHYYAVCWNEEKILPFVYSYYGKFVDRFFIYDNGSTDRTAEIIAAQPNAKLIHFETDGFDDTVHADIKNNCWKKSRGKADLVIVCDADEFLYHPDLTRSLQNIIEKSISLPNIDGYNMFSYCFPDAATLITEQIKTGIQDNAYSKNILFDPHRIVEIGFFPGSHKSRPIGIVKTGTDTFKLLHYKNLGLEYLMGRHDLLSQRLSETNKKEGLGVHYMYPPEKVEHDFQLGISACSNVIPKFSIIIPTLNSERTIAKALSSIQEQSFDDWEVLIMDGGSSDKTLDIIASLKEPRFKVFKEKDKGIYDAMNKGVLRSQGEWLYFLGSDDYLLRNSVLEEVLSDMDCSDMVYCDVQSTHLSSDYLGEWSYETLNYNRCHQGVFYRRHVFNTIGFYPLQYKVCADHYMNLRVFLHPELISTYCPVEVAFHSDGGYSSSTQDYMFEKSMNYIIARYGKRTLPQPILNSYCRLALKSHCSFLQRIWLYWTIMVTNTAV